MADVARRSGGVMRLWQTSAPGRWLASLAAALRGVRLHPSAALVGVRSHIRIARGASIGQQCVLRADGAGRVTIAEDVWFARDVEIETETHVAIGARTTVQRRCSINGTTRVGSDCIFAPDVFVSSGTHPFREIAHLPIREQERRLAAQGVSLDAPVWIQDDCWIGTHAVIAPGVTVGKGSVVGANSVVTHDVPPYSVVAGIPARVIGQRLAWEPPGFVDTSAETHAPYVLSVASPVLVALRREQAVRVAYEARSALHIKANGVAKDLSPGKGEFTVPMAGGLPFDAAIRIDVDDGDAGSVRFTRFECVPPES
jgi:acetyltransferase-like isoleucine patch superfamily enzyme